MREKPYLRLVPLEEEGGAGRDRGGVPRQGSGCDLRRPRHRGRLWWVWRKLTR